MGKGIWMHWMAGLVCVFVYAEALSAQQRVRDVELERDLEEEVERADGKASGVEGEDFFAMDAIPAAGILTDDHLPIGEGTDARIDSLMRSRFARYFAETDVHCTENGVSLIFPDSVYRRRLESLHQVIPMSYNETVRRYIDFYAGKRGELVRYMLGAANYYFPIIEPILERYGLPQELKYLPIVESALNPLAVSRVGAGGFWQFMLSTGKVYGLEINSLVDERCDPVKSTEAACRYFKDMYDMYGDWHLALASFNCGSGNLHKAIRRSGGKKDFWEIYPFLPRETRAYVPLFIAANYIMNYYESHNICPVKAGLPLATDTVMVTKMLHFEQVTDLLKVDIELIRMLNPQYRRDIVPGNIHPSALRLPAVTAYSFVDIEDSIYTHRMEELLALCIPLNVLEANKSAVREKIVHTAKAGENLHLIGNRYGVSARDIRRWNELSSNRVAAGKRLTLYVNNGGVRFARQGVQPAVSAPAVGAGKVVHTPSSGGRTYTVQSGDSLYSISRKYPGLTVTSLQRANNLNNSRLYPGQKLHIPAS
ncbi:MAG: LysM peptidoglycan-binding domain-containing protein [Tannerellaceae bacterium]|jgi:membrane-bound lytic murein transglycosylase D|nr:LysM peptidoglycan-binding domain-containing protein [Tannerellaceae bacterium]